MPLSQKFENAARWFFAVVQNKKLMALVLAGFLISGGIGAYVAKDYIAGVLSSQEQFLGAMLGAKTSTSAGEFDNKNAIAKKPAKDCLFETSQAPQKSPLILNEIAWMGNKESANNEWIELKNISSELMHIAGWSLINQSEKIKAVFKSDIDIPAGGFYILERGGLDFLPNVEADDFFTGSLKNSGDSLRLFDQDCNVIDQVLAESAWPAGDNKTKKTMERDSNTLAWHTSGIVQGTPRKENTPLLKVVMSPPKEAASQPQITLTPPPTPTVDSFQKLTQPPVSQANNHLLISEIMAGSETSSTDAFIEFYNPTSGAIDLTGWTIKKKTSTGSESSLIVPSRLKGKLVLPGTYFLAVNEKGQIGVALADVMWPASYLLARAKNSVVIYDSFGKKVEEVGWETIPKGQSYERNSWFDSAFHVQVNPNPNSKTP